MSENLSSCNDKMFSPQLENGLPAVRKISLHWCGNPVSYYLIWWLFWCLETLDKWATKWKSKQRVKVCEKFTWYGPLACGVNSCVVYLDMWGWLCVLCLCAKLSDSWCYWFLSLTGTPSSSSVLRAWIPLFSSVRLALAEGKHASCLTCTCIISSYFLCAFNFYKETCINCWSAVVSRDHLNRDRVTTKSVPHCMIHNKMWNLQNIGSP